MRDEGRNKERENIRENMKEKAIFLSNFLLHFLPLTSHRARYIGRQRVPTKEKRAGKEGWGARRRRKKEKGCRDELEVVSL